MVQIVHTDSHPLVLVWYLCCLLLVANYRAIVDDFWLQLPYNRNGQYLPLQLPGDCPRLVCWTIAFKLSARFLVLWQISTFCVSWKISCVAGFRSLAYQIYKFWNSPSQNLNRIVQQNNCKKWPNFTESQKLPVKIWIGLSNKFFTTNPSIIYMGASSIPLTTRLLGVAGVHLNQVRAHNSSEI